jgi:hypothetical protein
MILSKTLFVLTKEEMQQKGTPLCNKKKEKKQKKKKVKRPLPLCAQRLRFLTGYRPLGGRCIISVNQCCRVIFSKIWGAASRMCMTASCIWRTNFLERKILGTRYMWSRCPPMWAFVDGYPGDLFFIRFEDIFRLLHMFWMDKSMVCLISLSMAHNIIIERRGRIMIIDPFYMDELFLGAPGNRAIVSKYIKDFMVANKDKDYFLMPYFPE